MHHTALEMQRNRKEQDVKDHGTNGKSKAAEVARHSIEEALRELAATRDEAKVQAHLLSLEAKQRLAQVESSLRQFEQRLMDTSSPAEGLISRAKEFTHVLRDLLGESANKATLSTPVRVLMSRGVRTCSEHDSLKAAAQIMWEADCGAVPVVSDGNRLVGIITDRDVCMAAYLQGVDLSHAQVGSAMSRDLAVVGPDEPARVATEIMRRKRVRRVPVVERDGILVGLISLADLVRLAEPSQTWLTETLSRICEPNREKLES
ncbi:MAG TPA: CBS domain-containing protein [Polyangiaceae bacterium]|nr:CBS domain-containing protein [Polyangiaceae bacterium]